jgi:hypothetical protein
MITKILLAAICAIAVSSCSTSSKTNQTVDDVYYSPGVDGFVAIKPEKHASTATYEDNEILMSIRDPRWRSFDNDYAYTPYAFGYTSDYYYNPYYCAYPVYNFIVVPASPVNTTPRIANLKAYGSNYNNSNEAIKLDKVNAIKQQKSYNSNNPPSGFGNFLRQVFMPSSPEETNNTTNNNIYNNNNTNPNTTNNSSSNNSNNSNYNNRNYSPSSNGGGASSGGSISRPARNGR